jgi:methyl-accepting chemotaxis protein
MTSEPKPLVLAEARESIRQTIAEMHHLADELERAIEHVRTTRTQLISTVTKLHQDLDR